MSSGIRVLNGVANVVLWSIKVGLCLIACGRAVGRGEWPSGIFSAMHWRNDEMLGAA